MLRESIATSVDVSTISIQKWILKGHWGIARGLNELGFNYIDPKVDTESEPGLLMLSHQEGFNYIDPKVDTESVAGCHHHDRRHQVSTISIQKWILKVDVAMSEIPPLSSFNYIDPKVDTESARGLLLKRWIFGFQLYRSKSGY